MKPIWIGINRKSENVLIENSQRDFSMGNQMKQHKFMIIIRISKIIRILVSSDNGMKKGTIHWNSAISLALESRLKL